VGETRKVARNEERGGGKKKKTAKKKTFVLVSILNARILVTSLTFLPLLPLITAEQAGTVFLLCSAGLRKTAATGTAHRPWGCSWDPA
jgi:hypothetical protein